MRAPAQGYGCMLVCGAVGKCNVWAGLKVSHGQASHTHCAMLTARSNPRQMCSAVRLLGGPEGPFPALEFVPRLRGFIPLLTADTPEQIMLPCPAVRWVDLKGQEHEKEGRDFKFNSYKKASPYRRRVVCRRWQVTVEAGKEGRDFKARREAV